MVARRDCRGVVRRRARLLRDSSCPVSFKTIPTMARAMSTSSDRDLAGSRFTDLHSSGLQGKAVRTRTALAPGAAALCGGQYLAERVEVFQYLARAFGYAGHRVFGHVDAHFSLVGQTLGDSL